MAEKVQSNVIKANDLVIIYVNFNETKSLIISNSGIFQHKNGCWPHNKLIGQLYGEPIKSINSDYTIILLKPTPESWSLSLSHRTQIVYHADISLALTLLDIKVGDVVYEAGTGSGAVTYFLSRSVGPSGHVHTFEFNEVRVNLAKTDFEMLGISSYVTVHYRDISITGFPVDNLNISSIFLDLPQPYVPSIVSSCYTILKSNGRICSFSPCIEQVQQMVCALRQHGFSEVKIIECLVRNYKATKIVFPSPPLLMPHQYTPHNAKKRKTLTPDSTDEENRIITSIPIRNGKGHSGYLVFATKPHYDTITSS